VDVLVEEHVLTPVGIGPELFRGAARRTRAVDIRQDGVGILFGDPNAKRSAPQVDMSS